MTGWQFLDRHIDAILYAVSFIALIVTLGWVIRGTPSGPPKDGPGGRPKPITFTEPAVPPRGTSGVSRSPDGGR